MNGQDRPCIIRFDMYLSKQSIPEHDYVCTHQTREQLFDQPLLKLTVYFAAFVSSYLPREWIMGVRLVHAVKVKLLYNPLMRLPSYSCKRHQVLKKSMRPLSSYSCYMQERSNLRLSLQAVMCESQPSCKCRRQPDTTVFARCRS